MSKGGEGLANLPNPDHNTRKEVAEAVGIGERTIQKGTEVFRMAYPDEYVHDDLQNPEKYDVSDEIREVAREQVEAMDSGEQSFHGASREIERAQNRICWIELFFISILRRVLVSVRRFGILRMAFIIFV